VRKKKREASARDPIPADRAKSGRWEESAISGGRSGARLSLRRLSLREESSRIPREWKILTRSTCNSASSFSHIVTAIEWKTGSMVPF